MKRTVVNMMMEMCMCTCCMYMDFCASESGQVFILEKEPSAP